MSDTQPLRDLLERADNAARNLDALANDGNPSVGLAIRLTGKAEGVTTDRTETGAKCPIPGCGHALSMHNELGYCRSRTTPDRQGECTCDSTVPWADSWPCPDANVGGTHT